MQIRRLLFVVFLIALAAGVGAQVTASPEALLKAAQQREQIDGDLAGALRLYQRIVEQFPKDAVSAEALLRVATIQDRQGEHAAARETRERIISEFPRSGAATTARAQLSASGPDRLKETELMVTGKAGGMLGRGRVSPDGRYISFGDQLTIDAGGTGNLAIWDTRSGKTTIVNKFSNARPWADGFAEGSIWSPDGNDLAYSWRVEEGRRNRELRIVNRHTGRHRVVFQSAEGVPWLTPLAFSPDGRHIVTALGVPAGEGTVRSAELALISAKDGSKTTLKTFDGSMPGSAAFSPDGKYVAYDFESDNASPARDIYVIAVDGMRDLPIAADRSAHEVLLGWFADGHLLFTSDRSGPVDALAVRIRNGAPDGAPFVVKRDVGQLEPLGITNDGKVFVQKSVAMREIYIVELDPATGKAVRPPVPLARAQPAVLRSQPAWSPDGTRLAYVQFAPGVPQSIVIQTTATNEVRVYDVRVRNIDWPLWQPDGKALVFDGTGEDNVQRSFKLDLQTRAVTPISDSIVAGFSPDGQYLYGETRQRRGLLKRSLVDGSTSVVVPPPDVRGGLAWGGICVSPDGRWVSYLRGQRGNAYLAIRPADGGEERVLERNISGSYPRLAWTPDSKYIIFGMNWDQLFRISIEGGPRESLEIPHGFGIIRQRSMNADGRRLAFGAAGTHRELWVWENVIPKRP